MKFLKHRYFLSKPFSFFSSYLFCKYDIKGIDSLSQAQNELQNADTETLVIFDIDDTLTNPIEQMFRLVYLDLTYFDKKSVDFIKLIKPNSTKLFEIEEDTDSVSKFTSLVFSKTNFIVVETKTVPVINNLQSRGIKVIALTASNTGKFGVIENMQQWRLKNLKKCGIDFSQDFDLEEIVFNNFDTQYGFYPMFYKGMLLTAGQSKGKVLAAFLDSIKWKPRRIIFFDDVKQNCHSVAKEMKNRGIPSVCFWYRAAFKEKIKLNKLIVEHQYNYLLKHEDFLTEKEVTEMNQIYINKII